MSGPIVYEAREIAKSSPEAPLVIVAIPTRGGKSGGPPIEFTISLLQMQPPLNVHMAYCIQKGLLPAPARNAILETALKGGAAYVFFLDDDVLFPNMILYRLLTAARFHPEAGIISAVVPTKIEPCEPMLYVDQVSGAYWDWPLGALVPIESAGAGAMLVNLTHVRTMGDGPWFDDVVQAGEVSGEQRFRHTGQDRYFFEQMLRKTDCVHYADTGLLLVHYSQAENRCYLLPPEAPCFQKPHQGDAWVPILNESGAAGWRLLRGPAGSPDTFVGYLDWLQQQTPGAAPEWSQSLVGELAAH